MTPYLMKRFETERELHIAIRKMDPFQAVEDYNEERIFRMVNRFLMWKLPANFSPDCGISFQREYSAGCCPRIHEPVGTNLFDAVQAEGMVRCMVKGL